MDYFQKTALGKFISALTEEERQMLFQCYIADFIGLTIGVSSQKELQVSVWNRSWKPFGWGEEYDACECQSRSLDTEWLLGLLRPYSEKQHLKLTHLRLSS